MAFTDDVGRGNVIRRNTFHGTFNGIGSCGSAPPPNGFSTETDIYENTFADHADDATETEGYCANVRLWGNRIRDSLMAFAIAPAGTGPVWIVRNVAYDIGNTRSALVDGQSASGIKINSGYSTPVGPTFVYHNTFLTTAPATDAIWLMSPGYSSGMVSRNNVYAGTDRAFVKDNPIALDLDYDALDAGGQTLVWWQGTRYANLAALQAGTAQELHGIDAAPALTAPANGDFTPMQSSALIDRGPRPARHQRRLRRRRARHRRGRTQRSGLQRRLRLSPPARRTGLGGRYCAPSGSLATVRLPCADRLADTRKGWSGS